MEGTAAEKRAIRRFALRLPVTITSASGEHIAASAKTRDVSSHGICFYCKQPMAPGEAIEFTVTLPADVTMTEPISVHCEGKVVRSLPQESGDYEVAAAIDVYEFVISEEPPLPPHSPSGTATQQ